MGGVGNVLKQTVVMVTQLHTFTKNHQTTFPMGEFQVCTFYFNQSVKEMKFQGHNSRDSHSVDVKWCPGNLHFLTSTPGDLIHVVP